MVRGAVVQQPPVMLLALRVSLAEPIVCGGVGQHVREHAIQRSFAVCRARLHNDILPDRVMARTSQRRLSGAAVAGGSAVPPAPAVPGALISDIAIRQSGGSCSVLSR